MHFGFKGILISVALPVLVLLGVSSGDSAPRAGAPAPFGFNAGPDVIPGNMADLDVYGTSGTQRGLAIGLTSCNAGNQLVGYFAMPNTDHPVIAQNFYRMSGGSDGTQRFEQIGQSWVKHTFGAKQADSCDFGCQTGGDFNHLGVGCSDTYLAFQSADQASLGSRAWVNPFTGVFPANARDHTGHVHTATSHMILTEDADLSPALNPGASYYAELLYVTPDEYSWCQTHPNECNMYNNASYLQYSVSGTTSYLFTPVGVTARMTPALQAWPGAAVRTIEPDPGNDGRAFVASKVTGPVGGVYHYEYAIYNQNLDRAIRSFTVPIPTPVPFSMARETDIVSNQGFHAPPQHPGFPNDGTQGDAGYSSASWTVTQDTQDMTWSTETLAQNPNANAIRWGTLYNFRFDSNFPPHDASATIGFFKTGGPATVVILAPAATGGGTTPTPTPASPTVTPSPTPTASPSPSPCGTTVWSENFDGTPPPGWVSGCWSISTDEPDSPPNDAHCPDSPTTGLCVMTLPPITLPAGRVILSFRNNYNAEFSNGVYWDGGVLNVSSPNISGGDFLDITDSHVGGTFITGGYTGEISSDAGNPLAGRFAWSGNSHGYINTIINLGPNLAGQTVTFAFAFGSDKLVGGPGWRIDTIRIDVGDLCGATPTPTPPITPTPSPTPTGTPAGQAVNLSTRLLVQSGQQVGIGGFIIKGTTTKQVLLRGIGPSLTASGIPNALSDPTLGLRDANEGLVFFDDNWRENQEQQIMATGLAPTNDLESAIVVQLSPGSYTVVLGGSNGATGVGLVEVYDLTPDSNSTLANISTRAAVGTGNNIVIAGFVIGGDGNDTIVVRGIGPSLANYGLSNVLADPTLELRNSNGALLVSNDNWMDDPVQAAMANAYGLGLSDTLESVVVATLPPGSYTAQLAGKAGGTGIGLVELYSNPPPPTPTPTPPVGVTRYH